MKGLCVTHADNSQSLASVGNVLNVQTMTCVLYATMVTSIIYATDFIVLLFQEGKGKLALPFYI